MKKFKTFNMEQWKKERAEADAVRRKHWKVIIGHPLTWFVLTIAVVYTHAWWIS